MDITTAIALTLGAAWASGINLYAACFMLGFMGATGSMELPPDLQVLQNPMVMIAAGFMYVCEFFADKVPGVDTGWDAIHTFVRIPAGAVLAAGAMSGVAPEMQLVAGLLGGTLAAGTHFTKAGGRVLVNTSPEPFSNWGVSLTEDLAVVAGLWTALHHPLIFIGLIVLFVALMIWLWPKLWRGIKRVAARIRQLFSSEKPEAPGPGV
ncbi:MAG: DUF4126 domain-containing protein [Gammaproteobacteria bacterium]|nr:DUF4126 domain-containing protein [Gammaproteobacteria bacterium]